MTLTLILQITSCFFMTGLIWVIQLVHYPSFLFIDSKRFVEFENFHANRITWIVMPVMLLELFTAAILMLNNSKMIFVINFILIILTWISTFALSVPIHAQLKKEHNLTAVKKLIQTNWPRTILWSVRLGIWTYLLLNPSFV